MQKKKLKIYLLFRNFIKNTKKIEATEKTDPLLFGICKIFPTIFQTRYKKQIAKNDSIFYTNCERPFDF